MEEVGFLHKPHDEAIRKTFCIPVPGVSCTFVDLEVAGVRRGCVTQAPQLDAETSVMLVWHVLAQVRSLALVAHHAFFDTDIFVGEVVAEKGALKMANHWLYLIQLVGGIIWRGEVGIVVAVKKLEK